MAGMQPGVQYNNETPGTGMHKGYPLPQRSPHDVANGWGQQTMFKNVDKFKDVLPTRYTHGDVIRMLAKVEHWMAEFQMRLPVHQLCDDKLAQFIWSQTHLYNDHGMPEIFEEFSMKGFLNLHEDFVLHQIYERIKPTSQLDWINKFRATVAFRGTLPAVLTIDTFFQERWESHILSHVANFTKALRVFRGDYRRSALAKDEPPPKRSVFEPYFTSSKMGYEHVESGDPFKTPAMLTLLKIFLESMGRNLLKVIHNELPLTHLPKEDGKFNLRNVDWFAYAKHFMASIIKMRRLASEVNYICVMFKAASIDPSEQRSKAHGDQDVRKAYVPYRKKTVAAVLPDAEEDTWQDTGLPSEPESDADASAADGSDQESVVAAVPPAAPHQSKRPGYCMKKLFHGECLDKTCRFSHEAEDYHRLLNTVREHDPSKDAAHQPRPRTMENVKLLTRGSTPGLERAKTKSRGYALAAVAQREEGDLTAQLQDLDMSPGSK